MIIDLAQKVARRDVVLSFKCNGNLVFPEGKVDGMSHCEDKTVGYARFSGDIIDGKVTLNLPVPCKINVRCKDAVGYWFKEVGVPVPAGDDTYHLDITARPAGSVFGKILDADGSLMSCNNLDIYTVKQSDGVKESDITYDVFGGRAGDSGKFTGCPIPLGGKYIIKAQLKNAIVESKPFVLDQNHSIHECNLQFKRLVNVNGQVLSPGGLPMKFSKVTLRYKVDKTKGEYYSLDQSFSPAHIDSNGRFTFTGINPDVLGDYYLEVDGGQDYLLSKVKIRASNKPVTIKLEKGLSVRGIVLDEKTGWGVPGLRVGGWPDEFTHGIKRGLGSTLTNDKGEFVIYRLRDMGYALSVGYDYKHGNVSGTKSLSIVNGPKKIKGKRKLPLKLKVKIPVDSEKKAVKPIR